MQIVTVQPAYLLRSTTRVLLPDVDQAVEFASWLQSQGFPVEMSESSLDIDPRPELERMAADALTEMYLRARA